MNMLLRLIVFGILVCLALAFSLAAFIKERTAGSLVQVIGAAFLLIVVLVHAAEAYHLLPQMGWGLPNSPGHYLDLLSAISGPTLLVAGYLLRRSNRWKKAR